MPESKGRGRPNKYETNIKPRLKEIEQLCLSMSEKQIADIMGVSQSTWCDYKNKYSELSEAIKKGRQNLVFELKSTLIKKAKGFQYSEKKIIQEGGRAVRVETYEKASLPDVAALNLLLKNYDPDHWANDPQALAIRKKEIELQERKIEQNDW